MADCILRDPSGVTPELRTRLLGHFSPEQLVELAAQLSLFLGISKVNVVVGLETDSDAIKIVPVPRGPESIAGLSAAALGEG
jgi:hypothetical protein